MGCCGGDVRPAASRQALGLKTGECAWLKPGTTALLLPDAAVVCPSHHRPEEGFKIESSSGLLILSSLDPGAGNFPLLTQHGKFGLPATAVQRQMMRNCLLVSRPLASYPQDTDSIVTVSEALAAAAAATCCNAPPTRTRPSTPHAATTDHSLPWRGLILPTHQTYGGQCQPGALRCTLLALRPPKDLCLCFAWHGTAQHSAAQHGELLITN